MAQRHRARGGQLKWPRPDKEGGAELFLECVDVARQGGLRYPQPVCSTTVVALVFQHHEQRESLKIHCYPPRSDAFRRATQARSQGCNHSWIECLPHAWCRSRYGYDIKPA
jgi:hypothetical protein